MKPAFLPVVAIVGRPNVGKSSLFNRLIRRRQAIIDRAPGVTRDRLEAPVSWRGRTFLIVDTGGLVLDARSSLDTAIQRQVTRAIDTADLLLFLGDLQTGVLPLDALVADVLRRAGKPILVVANKADSTEAAQRAVEFHAVGFGEPMAVSGLHGRGIGELLDAVVSRLPSKAPVVPAAPAGPTDSPALRLAIVGRPNVGKSTLTNRLAGEERVTVDASPGTTRDAIEVLLTRGRADYRVVDTAGVRARPKLKTLVDIVSVKRSMAAIDQADACVMLLDISVGLLADDLTLLGKIVAGYHPCVVGLNKWDLIQAGTPERYVNAFRRRVPFAAFAPVFACSTKTGYRIDELLRTALDVAERARRPIEPAALREAWHRLEEAADRPGRLGQIRFVRLRQTIQRPVTFELTVRGRVRPQRAELAFIERTLRTRLDLEGIPVRLIVRVV